MNDTKYINSTKEELIMITLTGVFILLITYAINYILVNSIISDF